MPHIIIDGYNYLHRVRATSMHNGSNLDMLRHSLLEKLVYYKRQKHAKITVVFDAYRGFSTSRQSENYKGIDVVYSKEHETADDVIIGWIREKRAGIVIVSSDRAIIDEAKQHGVTFITPLKMEELIAGQVDGKDKETDGEGQPIKKKGNP
ncbi:MAG: NYN domain-containing protein, partial [Proteobacteria bacterium]|nr:NYN domain-containing protein [Pseudomonadota bacterium]